MEDNLVLKALEVLKKACKDLQVGVAAGDEGDDEDDSEDEQGEAQEDDLCESPSMKALLALHSESQDAGLLSTDPALKTLSALLSRLASLYRSTYVDDSVGDGGGGGGLLGALSGGISGLLSSLLDLQQRLMPKNQRRRRKSGRRSKCWEISQVAGSIESEIQSWIDRESVGRLVSALRKLVQPSSHPTAEQDTLTGLLRAFGERLSRGFDRGLQDAVLRQGAFPAVAAALAKPSVDLHLREGCAAAVEAMVRFNRDVFVGHVLMGGGADDSSSSVLRSLVAMGTPSSMRVLQSLVAAIKIALVDEIHADGQIPGLVVSLSSLDTDMATAALELLLQMAYYARKDAADCMIESGIVKRLMVLQRSHLDDSPIKMDGSDACAATDCCFEGEATEGPLASCVARFAIQLEVGEGLRRRERAELKLAILERVRNAAASEAEAATIVAEVLWGASP